LEDEGEMVLRRVFEELECLRNLITCSSFGLTLRRLSGSLGGSSQLLRNTCSSLRSHSLQSSPRISTLISKRATEYPQRHNKDLKKNLNVQLSFTKTPRKEYSSAENNSADLFQIE